MCSGFLYRVLSETFFILSRIQRTYVFIESLLLTVEFNVSRIFSTDFFFRKNTRDIKFHENLSIGNRVVACGQVGRRDEANTFRNFAERA